jgi:hypothetical protein
LSPHKKPRAAIFTNGGPGLLSLNGELRQCHAVVQVNVLDGLEEFDALFHGLLEGFAAGDEAYVAIGYLIKAEEDGVVGIRFL